jgi:hypothetical protein
MNKDLPMRPEVAHQINVKLNEITDKIIDRSAVMIIKESKAFNELSKEMQLEFNGNPIAHAYDMSDEIVEIAEFAFTLDSESHKMLVARYFVDQVREAIRMRTQEIADKVKEELGDDTDIFIKRDNE